MKHYYELTLFQKPSGEGPVPSFNRYEESELELHAYKNQLETRITNNEFFRVEDWRVKEVSESYYRCVS